MKPTTLIAKRFLRTGSNFAGKYTGLVAVLGIAIGCFALIVSIAVLNGFESKVIEKIIGIEGEIRIRGNNIPKKSMDDVCLTKFECCNTCYLQYVEGREERWLKGWRPSEDED